MSKKIKKIVCMGGGTGVSMVLSGLINYPLDLKAVVTMFDDGGSSGKLVKEFNFLPPGDLRQCLSVVSGDGGVTRKISKLFSYRYKKGMFKGHSLGNLIIAAAAKEEDKFLNKAIQELGEILSVRANIYPVTLKLAKIKAKLKNGKIISGEENIINFRNLAKIGIAKIYLDPKVKANPKAVSAILQADAVIIGPGKFYTSVMPNLLVDGIPQAIRQSSAKKIFICNLMNQEGNTDDFKVEDFAKSIEGCLGRKTLDYVIFNNGKLGKNSMKKVKKIFPKATLVESGKKLPANFVSENLLDNRIRKLNPADILVKGANQRTIVFHDSKKLAKILVGLIGNNR